MYNFLSLLLLIPLFIFQQNPADNQNGITYKVFVNGEWQDKAPDTLPKFGTEKMAMERFIAKNLRYPLKAQRAGITGTVWVTAEITEDGKIVNEQLEQDLGYGLGQETLRVIQMIPDEWAPATLDGKPIRTQLRIPTRFTIMK